MSGLSFGVCVCVFLSNSIIKLWPLRYLFKKVWLKLTLALKHTGSFSKHICLVPWSYIQDWLKKSASSAGVGHDFELLSV